MNSPDRHTYARHVTDDFRAMLRAIPAFPDELPVFDPVAAPDDPAELFLRWFDEARSAGVFQPHVFALATSDRTGDVTSRTLILKNVEAGEFHFATSRTSLKGAQLAQNPRAAITFYWREQGRQVRLRGSVRELSAEASAADWRDRPGTTGEVDAAWQLFALRPTEAHFWQARHDRQHVQLDYPRT